jgi:hypothetical protein
MFKRLRKIPVVHRAPGPDYRRKQSIDEAAVVIESFCVRSAGPGGLDAGPGDRKTLALLVQLFGQCDVLRIQVVLIAGNIPCHAALLFPVCG